MTVRGGIFTSYRRADSAAFAGRIADFFSYRYPDVRVFFDVAAIEPGANFVDTIRSRLRSSEVVLAIIGDGWLSATDASFGRRLDDPNDLVRLELSMALSLGTRVIPILLDNAQMPSQGQLPVDLKPLALCNAEFIRGVTFAHDAQHLADFVREYLENSKKIMTAPPLAPARDVNSPVKLGLVNAFARFRDCTAEFMICENGAKQFVQFRKSPPDAVVIDLPSQTLSPKQLVAAGRLSTENYQAEAVDAGDGNITYNATLPLDPAFLSHTTLDVFEHVYGALPEKPLKITMNWFGGEPRRQPAKSTRL
jgi:TIR domain